MKTKILLSLMLIFISLGGFSKTWIVSNKGSAFSEADITINIGDTVSFSLSSSHNVVEVSKSTYDANDNTPLPGFTLPYGGGQLLPAQLTVGTHYYVCTPHAVWGMKGTIVVQSLTDKEGIKNSAAAKVYPNPSAGLFHVTLNNLKSKNNNPIEIYNLKGERVYSTLASNSMATIDLINSLNGVYLMIIYDGEGVIEKKIIKQ